MAALAKFSLLPWHGLLNLPASSRSHMLYGIRHGLSFCIIGVDSPYHLHDGNEVGSLARHDKYRDRKYLFIGNNTHFLIKCGDY